MIHVSNKTFREYMAEKAEFDLDYADQRALFAYYNDIGSLDDFEDNFCGIFNGGNENEAIGEYAAQLADDCGDLRNVPEWIRGNIDWEGIGYDFRVGGDNYAIELDYREWAVFRNS